MPQYQISIVNAEFRVCNEVDADSVEDASRLALRGGLAIGSEEVGRGTPFFAAEVKVEEGDQLLQRFMVSVGSSPLQ